MAEAIAFGKLKGFKMPTNRVNHRKLSVDEIKDIIKEEFGEAKKTSDVEVQDRPKGWGDAEIANEIEWIEALDLKEFFDKKKRK